MKHFLFFGMLSALLLTLFLLLRPTLSVIGSPVVPDTAGRAKELLPEEQASGVAEAAVAKTPRSKPVAGAPLEPIERQIVTLTNEARANAGLPPLTNDDSLQRAARSHGRDMIVRAFADSINPDGLTAEDRVTREDRHAVVIVRENIGSASPKESDLARRIVADWMGDPTTREKILTREYAQIGVGVVPSSSDVRAVQLLARTVARTVTPVPQRAKSGSTIDVELDAAASPVRCNAVDLFSSETGLAVAGPAPLGELALNVAPGIYKLRFHCASPAGPRIESGPRIEVTP
jgi:uncharacterized protein YkwD